jgi:hypothetical protein
LDEHAANLVGLSKIFKADWKDTIKVESLVEWPHLIFADDEDCRRN